jgi:hypothetical protein
MIGYDHACDRAQVAFYRLQGSCVQHTVVWEGKEKLLGGNKGKTQVEVFLTMAYRNSHDYYCAHCLSSWDSLNTSLLNFDLLLSSFLSTVWECPLLTVPTEWGRRRRLRTGRSEVQFPAGEKFLFQNVAGELWNPRRLLFSSPGVKGAKLSHRHLVPRLGMSGAVPIRPLYAFMAFTGTALNLHPMTETASVSVTLWQQTLKTVDEVQNNRHGKANFLVEKLLSVLVSYLTMLSVAKVTLVSGID